ncbi:hypothetical protein [Cronobacter sakazakii]|uniref:hypothetical protein n=1 Tax=Cronobacter sakazakii TaxID=28141 RepID=UPI002810D4F6|nr:hypothetical protein [Cronobacter sakazakii]MDQ9180468.1 hypothetical protein [Cronobacter sakazakii]MDQ9195924.1 hypothetical protein [Cronobacter sakazakii]
MDKSREQFEAWYLRRWGHTEDNHDTLFEIGPDDDCYYRLGVRMAYDAWQASRAAAEVEIPEVEKWRSPEAVRAQRAMLVLVNQAIRAAGLKVKGE